MRQAFTLKTTKVPSDIIDNFVTIDGSKFNDGYINVLFDGHFIERLDAPEELRRSFEILPRKKALVAEKDGEIFLRLIRFVDLHRHSGYSLLDGGSDIKSIVQRTELYGAITDHGSAYGTLEFQKEMLKNNKKPIIGIEFYAENIDGKKDGNHLLVLVKNAVGYKNMCKLISLAEENMYYKPHVSYEMLEKYGEGLIVTSACLGGEVSQILLKGDYDKALEVVETYQGMFGHDYYLEIQRHNIPEEEIVNPLLIKLSKETGVKLIAATDSHYPDKEDSFAHEVLLAIGTKAKLSDPKRYKFDGEGYHIHTADELEELYADIPEVIYNLYEIAEKCDFKYNTGNIYMPHFPVPKTFKDETSYFEHLCWEGFKSRFDGTEQYIDPEYKERLDFEIEIIKNMGYEGYFLIVWDFIKYAKDNGIMVGPGRGSAVGSLVSYVLRITDLDPIPYGLLFERFLNPERISLPDIDVDFEDERRSEVIDYIKTKYGSESVSGIITFGTLAARSAIRDVSRVLEYDYTFSDRLAKLIPEVPGITLNKAFKASPEFNTLYKTNSDVKRVVDIALKLEGLPRHRSQHACGHVITNGKVYDYVPEVLLEDKEVKGKKSRTAAFNMGELEELGLLKMDFLGLRNMYILGEAIRLINEKADIPVIYEKIDLEDPYIYKFIGTGNTAGIFQIESPGMQSLMKQMFSDVSQKITEIENNYGISGYVNPKNISKEGTCDVKEYKKAMKTLGIELFERLVAAISLYRPGPMDYIPDYIDGMNNPEHIKYDTPELESILGRTYGVIVYQEQVQQIVRKLAGYSLGRGDLIRRAMGKKKMSIMEAEKQVFLYGNADSKKEDELLVPGCIANGISEKVAIIIWDKMAEFANYAFNKSHSAGYAVISASTAYLRLYHPVEFFVATLNSVVKKQDKLKYYLAELSKAGIVLLPPDINNSKKMFTIEGSGIRFGLMGLRNLGKMADGIVEEREKGEFKSLEDLVDRMIFQVDKKMLEALIYSGALDGLKDSGTRQAKIMAVPEILEFLKKVKKIEAEDVWFNLSELDAFYIDLNKIQIDKSMDEFEKRFKLEQEYKYAGLYITSHPMDDHMFTIEQIGTSNISDVLPSEELEETTSSFDGRFVKIAGILKEVKVHYTKKGDLMYFLQIEDKGAEMKGVMFPSSVEGNEHLLENEIVVIEGRIQSNEMGTQIIASKITKVEDFKIEEPKAILLVLDNKEQFQTAQKLINKYTGLVKVYIEYDKKKFINDKGINLNLSSFLEIKNNFTNYKVV